MTKRTLDVEAIRKDFPILATMARGKPLVYLDNAATSQKPRQVIETMDDFLRTGYAPINRSAYRLAAEATDRFEGARAAVARLVNAPSADEIVFTKDATEALNLVASSWGGANLREGDAIVLTHMEHHANIVPWHFLRECQGAVLKWVDVDMNGDLDPQAVIDAITPRTRMVFLNTPNNPTGQLISIGDLTRISEAVPGAVVLVDEAYIEFGGTTFLPQLPKYPNVLVGRTFSKAYGLAGLRLGVVIGQPQALDPVRAVTLPFNINGVALTALRAALDDTEFLPRYATQVRQSRERLYAACRRLGLQYWPSAANYVMVHVGETAPYVQALAARAIHVRDRSKDPTTPGCIRITAGMIEHTDAAIEALDYWVIVNDDGELELTKDAKDDAGNPLTFGQRIRKGSLPTTDVTESSFDSIFAQEVLDKLLALRPEDG